MTYDRRGGERRDGERRDDSAEARFREERLAHYIADLSARLRPVSAHLTEEEFAKLVADVAAMKVRFDEMDAEPGALRPTRQPDPKRR